MGDEEYSAEQQRTSKYNSAIAILYRIDELWKDCHRHARNGELKKWNWDLDRVWCELVDDADEENKKEFKKHMLNVSKVLSNPNALYQALLEKEIFLRKLQNTQGKGNKYDEGAEEYMG